MPDLAFTYAYVFIPPPPPESVGALVPDIGRGIIPLIFDPYITMMITKIIAITIPTINLGI
jgi:hypothetical protein